MPKLNQIIAVEKGVKARTQRTVTDTYHACQKPALFNGFDKTYQPKDEEGEVLRTIDLSRPWRRLTLTEAILEYSDLTPEDLVDRERMEKAARDLDERGHGGDTERQPDGGTEQRDCGDADRSEHLRGPCDAPGQPQPTEIHSGGSKGGW